MASNDLVKQLEKNQMAVAKIEKQIESEVGHQIEKLEKLKATNAEMREAIKTAMEQNGVTKFDGDLITITYVAPTQRTTFDSKRFKDERPKTYEKYLRTSEVKSSIRLKVKA